MTAARRPSDTKLGVLNVNQRGGLHAWQAGPLPAIHDAGLRPITVDGRGVGASDAPPAPYSITQLGDDTAALINHLGLGPVHLVGLSQGGFIAEHLASTQPDLVRSATLIASSGITTPYTRVWAEAWRDLISDETHIPNALLILDGIQGLPAHTLRDDHTTTTNWINLLRSQSDLTSPSSLAQSSACCEWLLGHDHAEGWRRIEAPCLVLSFEHDLHWPPRIGREAAAAIRRGEFVEIPGVGHTNGLFEASAANNEALIDFLHRHDHQHGSGD